MVKDLHCIVKYVIVGFRRIGFQVICVVSDNKGVNCKAMQLFCKDYLINFLNMNMPCDINRRIILHYRLSSHFKMYKRKLG